MQTPSHDRIAQLAYQLWQERGCPEGSPEVDWQHAVQQLQESSGGDNEVLSSRFEAVPSTAPVAQPVPPVLQPVATGGHSPRIAASSSPTDDGPDGDHSGPIAQQARARSKGRPGRRSAV